jgi:hypothetical protein
MGATDLIRDLARTCHPIRITDGIKKVFYRVLAGISTSFFVAAGHYFRILGRYD